MTIAARMPILTASGVMNGVIAIIPAAAGSVASPACSALIPNADGFWKYRLSTYMQRVDRARNDQDRERRADQHLVAQQLEVHQRRAHPPLHHHERPGPGDRDRPGSRSSLPIPSPSRCPRSARAPAGLARPRSAPCRRSRSSASGPDRLTPSPSRSSAAHMPPRSRRRSRTAPASRWCRRAAPPTSGPERRAHCRRRAPDRDRSHLPGTGGGDGQQAHAAGQDRRPCGALDHPPDDDAGAACATARSARTRRRTARDRRGRPAVGPSTSPSAPEVTITAAPTSK